VDDRGREQATPSDRHVGTGKPPVLGASRGVDHHDITADGDEARLHGQDGELTLDTVGKPSIVSIEWSDETTLRALQQLVATRRDSRALPVPNGVQTGIANRSDYLPRVVARPVVDDEKLEVGHRLAEDTAQSHLDVPLVVTRRDEDGDERR
jgi:hypothetical protein